MDISLTNNHQGMRLINHLQWLNLQLSSMTFTSHSGSPMNEKLITLLLFIQDRYARSLHLISNKVIICITPLVEAKTSKKNEDSLSVLCNKNSASDTPCSILLMWFVSVVIIHKKAFFCPSYSRSRRRSGICVTELAGSTSLCFSETTQCSAHSYVTMAASS